MQSDLEPHFVLIFNISLIGVTGHFYNDSRKINEMLLKENYNFAKRYTYGVEIMSVEWPDQKVSSSLSYNVVIVNSVYEKWQLTTFKYFAPGWKLAFFFSLQKLKSINLLRRATWKYSRSKLNDWSEGECI